MNKRSGVMKKLMAKWSRNIASGWINLPDGSGVLIFDIKGNGSNIKTFEVIGK